MLVCYVIVIWEGLMNKKALLVVDIQTALVLEKPFAVEKVISNIKSLLKICRENDVEITYVRHNGFKRHYLKYILEECNFKEITFETVYEGKK